MNDKIAEIRERWAEFESLDHQSQVWDAHLYMRRAHSDRATLLAEVDRLRADLATQQGCCDGAAAQDAHVRREREEHRAEVEKLRTENERLRAERDALRDAAREYLTTLGGAMKTGKFQMGGTAEMAHFVRQAMASAEVFGGRAYLRTPMLLPSGASVVVVIEQEGAGRFGITDLGQGYDEAETLGFGRIYRRQAEHVACHQGLAAHQGALAVHDLGPEELTGATMALASAVLRTMERAMLRASDRRPQAAADRLIARLSRLFPGTQVRRDIAARIDRLVRKRMAEAWGDGWFAAKWDKKHVDENPYRGRVKK